MRSETKIAHIEGTTLHSAIDALGLSKHIPEITLNHLLSLSQFIEALVINDKLLFEIKDQRDPDFQNWCHYMDYIYESGIVKIIGNQIIGAHCSHIDDDLSKIDAFKWAIERIDTMQDLTPLKYAVFSRKSATDGVKDIKGIKDENNPVLRKCIDLIHGYNEKSLIDKYHSCSEKLKKCGISDLGFHILIRIYLLFNWLKEKNGISYFPNFSRSILIENLDHRIGIERPQFDIWSMRKLKGVRIKEIEALYGRDEFNEDWIDISPIFIACLNGAKSPLNVLENAIKLREDRYITRFREFCSNTKLQESEKRRKFNDLLKDTNSVIRNLMGKIEFSSPPTFGFRVMDLEIIKEWKLKMFVHDMVRDAIDLFAAQVKIEKIFGKISYGNQPLLFQGKK